ncbi:putative protein phosphatase 2C 12 [Dendrobium catenatum]|uniref:protein-serine/threonine phosphatase n=1 Tax=Dendrobium catenatum TaxID=906689 RepID=A0A2I0VXG2_9ASPA|nr:putative protein phosphatase 2C 12 [Dendrobium catenatum]
MSSMVGTGAGQAGSAEGDWMMPPLSVLLKRELTSEKIGKPDILHGLASRSKKGEDLTFLKTECQRVPGNGATTFSVFALFDGHNGLAAAIYAKENLLNNILCAIPSGLTRDEWLAALPRALVAGFVKTDKDFQDKAEPSGTTVTFVIIDGWAVTVASVGDSRCILESADGSLYLLSADHRLDENKEEVERVTASGGEVGRLYLACGAEIGPLRCWPGGLCLSRSIGDVDVGEFIIPIPHVKQVKLSNAGGRLIISSDGVWDVLTFESALNCSRGHPADIAANKIVTEAVLVKGLRDDTTCIVVDLLPPENISPFVSQPKKKGMRVLKNMFHKKPYDSPSHLFVRNYFGPYAVEELFEDGSAVLAQRLNMVYPICNMFKLLVCAVCQVEMKPGEGISVHAGSLKSGRVCLWEGPLLCQSCQFKKEAMEGKRPSRSKIQDMFFFPTCHAVK